MTSYGQAPNSINAPSQFQPASMMQTPAPLVAQPWSMPGTQSMPLVTPLIQTAQLPAAAAVMAPVRISPTFCPPLFIFSVGKNYIFSPINVNCVALCLSLIFSSLKNIGTNRPA